MEVIAVYSSKKTTFAFTLCNKKQSLVSKIFKTSKPGKHIYVLSRKVRQLCVKSGFYETCTLLNAV